MYTNRIFKINSDVYQKKSRLSTDVASTHSAAPLAEQVTWNDSSGSLVAIVCLVSAMAVLVLVAATFYYYRKRSQLLHSNHKVLLIKKDIPLEKSFVIRKTPAVRSPSSSQVNPFNKKSPSPTSAVQPSSLSPIDDTAKSDTNNNSINEQANVKTNQVLNNNLKHSPVKGEINAETCISNGNHVAKPKEISENDQCPVSVKEGHLGKLHFKLKYSYEKRAICLVILRCTDLPLRDANGGSIDPYVKMQLLPEKQHKAKTRVLRKTQNPVYNEEFTFYGITSNYLESLVVHFVVLNFDRFSRDEILGEVVCKLNQFEFDSLEKQITLIRDIAPRGNKLKIQELGELLVSLCYQPIANRLTVVILKARNLPKMDLTGLCDPYVKIYVYHNGQRVSKKRTHVKKRTLSPVFNESFVFDIPPEEGLDNIQLQFLVYDHDRVTRNELIGKIDIGSRTGVSSTEKHWHEVIKSPRRQIAEWHKLKE